MELDLPPAARLPSQHRGGSAYRPPTMHRVTVAGGARVLLVSVAGFSHVPARIAA